MDYPNRFSRPVERDPLPDRPANGMGERREKDDNFTMM
jgi:hypothetical protein